MAEPPVRRRWGCLPWIIIVLSVLLVLLTLAALWYRSEGDLREVERRAAAAGVARTWTELGIPQADPERLERWRKLRVMATATTYYGESCNFPDYPENWMNAPIPDGLTAFYATQPPWEEVGLAELVSAWNDGVIALEHDPAELDALARGRNWTGLWNTVGIFDVDSLRDMLSERILLLQGRQLDEALATLAGLATVGPTSAFYDASRTQERWADLVVRRLADLPDPSRTAALAHRMADLSDARLAARFRETTVLLLQASRGGFDLPARRLGIALPAIMEVDAARAVFWRCGRSTYLNRQVQTTAHAAKLAGSWADILAAVPDVPQRSYTNLPTEMISSIFDGGHSCCGSWGGFSGRRIQLMLHLRTTTRLRLLAATLDGQTWPTDPCDPAGGPLRPILVNGRTIGAYSIGHDGVDDHGDRKHDWVYPLEPPPLPPPTP